MSDTKYYGTILLDMDKSHEQQESDWMYARQIISEKRPDVRIIGSYGSGIYSRLSQTAELLRTLSTCDILFCNTCGSEERHIYRFIRAIAKSEGITIVPIRTLMDNPEWNPETQRFEEANK